MPTLYEQAREALRSGTVSLYVNYYFFSSYEVRSGCRATGIDIVHLEEPVIDCGPGFTCPPWYLQCKAGRIE